MSTRSAVSAHGLGIRVGHRRNPYTYMISDNAFDELLLRLALRRAESIWSHGHLPNSRAPHGRYARECMAFVLMDATAGPWVPNDEAVLAAITVGDDGERFLANAAGKAAGHRRLGLNYGQAVLIDSHRCHTGGFRYGHSAEVRGQIVAASSQTTDQDLFEAGQMATEFVAALIDAHHAWKERIGTGEWYNDHDAADNETRALVDWFHA